MTYFVVIHGRVNGVYQEHILAYAQLEGCPDAYIRKFKPGEYNLAHSYCQKHHPNHSRDTLLGGLSLRFNPGYIDYMENALANAAARQRDLTELRFLINFIYNFNFRFLSILI
jgi:hypothetical protein